MTIRSERLSASGAFPSRSSGSSNPRDNREGWAAATTSCACPSPRPAGA
jgi:hypothetical protein